MLDKITHNWFFLILKNQTWHLKSCISITNITINYIQGSPIYLTKNTSLPHSSFFVY